jgi:Icc-related predicted phosphoesterase
MAFFTKKSRKQLTRLLFATDVHGSERTYRKFINAGKFYHVEILVMGGDITGKLLIPIIKEKNGHHRATLQGSLRSLDTEEELKKMIDTISLLGFYYQLMEEDEFHSFQQNQSKIDNLFHDLARQRLESWIDLAETRLAGTGIKCYVTGGNDDDPEVLAVLNRVGIESFIACEGKVVSIDDSHTMVSVGLSTPTPWNTPREVSEEKLAAYIEEAVSEVPDLNKAIFNFHDPPKDSTLDTCPLLDWSTDPPAPIFRAGQMVMAGAGSKSVRSAIEKYQPMLGLHGHIHEAQGVVKIGRTTCVNPGSEYGEGILRGCLITFANGEVEGFQMTSG